MTAGQFPMTGTLYKARGSSMRGRKGLEFPSCSCLGSLASCTKDSARFSGGRNPTTRRLRAAILLRVLFQRKTCALNSEPQALNPKPSTPNPDPVMFD